MFSNFKFKKFFSSSKLCFKLMPAATIYIDNPDEAENVTVLKHFVTPL